MTKTEQKEMAWLKRENERLRMETDQAVRQTNEYATVAGNATRTIGELQLQVSKLQVEHDMLFQALKDSHRIRKANEAQITQMAGMASLGQAVTAGVEMLAQFAGEPAKDDDGQ